MEIRIKTAEEFWRDKVSIEISGTAAEVQTVGQRLVRGREPGYWADACEAADKRVRDLLDERAGNAGTIEGLRDRVAELEQTLARYMKAHVCTDRCTKDAHVAMEGRSLVAGLESDLADAQARIGELDGQLRRAIEEQRRRFTEGEVDNAKEGARADERARLDREVILPANTKLSQVHAAVLGTELAREIKEYEQAHAAGLMTGALREVRRVMGVTSV